MTTFPRSPRLHKGRLVSVDPFTQQKSSIEFQYNPDTMTRRLEARSMGGEGGDKAEVYRLTGPPKETITLNIEIDASDKLDEGDAQAQKLGIHPSLAALELLLYPTLDALNKNEELARQGNIEIIPPEAPLTLFVWGEKRVLPVRLTSFSITEEAYDALLNPIRAKIDLSLQVLSYADFQQAHQGYDLFKKHQSFKEQMAKDVTGSVVGAI